MENEANKKQKLDSMGGQEVETVKAFDKPRAPLTATAGAPTHHRKDHTGQRSLVLFSISGEIKSMLDAIEKEILPKTEASVTDKGNKVNCWGGP